MVYLLPFLTVLIWGGNAIVNKIAASTIEPSAMSFYRWALAMLVMTPFCLPKLKRYWPEIRRNSGKLAFLALLGMVLNQSLGYYAALTTSASNMALITSLVPLISVFMSVPLLGKKISMLSIAGGVISLAGLAFMLGQGDVAFFMHQTVAQGDLLMVLAAFVYATYCVLLKRWKMQLSSWMLIYTQGVFAVIMLFPLLLTSETIMPTSASLPLIAYAGLLASLIAPLCWVKAIDLIGADNSAMFMNLLPVIAVALAAALLGETITQFHVIGGLMVISGVILSQVKVRRRKSATDTVEQNLTIDKQ
ncbi:MULTISPECIES: DMT family transporter [Vibrio]|jgi:drug/metabolite transporter (DMT)-like permease|uniref:EamA/RhaT family transporter n=1 Tax=Vibrio mediterranei TaxID=689 RepID=A0ABX5DHB0_9VIBR|nr:MULTISPECIES: DMT family transporter [Vibrio]KFA97614.1 multidrug DMT transporter [Vibrio sp. ER1A]MCG9623711.1 DMT family transporter [Vibrio mediterranei]MCG9660161.1 DMT family transporter [Vibrio mediterranei]MCG9663623.1 DMT family transporter [Vibrio mediterranei]PCD88248.1 EamA/RhaT family transporter [Vibrio mediterranei]